MLAFIDSSPHALPALTVKERRQICDQQSKSVQDLIDSLKIKRAEARQRFSYCHYIYNNCMKENVNSNFNPVHSKDAMVQRRLFVDEARAELVALDTEINEQLFRADQLLEERLLLLREDDSAVVTPAIAARTKPTVATRERTREEK